MEYILAAGAGPHY